MQERANRPKHSGYSNIREENDFSWSIETTGGSSLQFTERFRNASFETGAVVQTYRFERRLYEPMYSSTCRSSPPGNIIIRRVLCEMLQVFLHRNM